MSVSTSYFLHLHILHSSTQAWIKLRPGRRDSLAANWHFDLLIKKIDILTLKYPKELEIVVVESRLSKCSRNYCLTSNLLDNFKIKASRFIHYKVD